MDQVPVPLFPDQFSEKEKPLIESGQLSARLFRFDSGVCSVRLQNGVGELVMLPFQGQQIWRAEMAGRNLTMKSMFDQPYPTRDFLSTYGAFLLHCGATAMGSPGPSDTHALHGELPNATYPTALVVLAEDDQGIFVGLTGSCGVTLAFNYNYIAQPMVKLYSGSTIFHVSMTITNLKQTPMPLMYLTHINFRPVDDGRLVYSVPCDPAHMHVRASLPDFVEVPSGYREFLEELRIHPEKHLSLKPGLEFDPEVVFYLDYMADKSGWAHALQVHPDGSADVMRHRPTQLDHGVTWICRTPDQDALGFEPATAGVEGYSAEKKKGNVRSLAGGQSFHCDVQVGVLEKAEAQREEKAIEDVVASGSGR